MTKPPGVILWEGQSPLDSAPIVAIATLTSKNVKTGDMIQVWILCQNMHPWEAVQSGSDYSICGSCPHRGNVINGKNEQRSCYVAVEKAPSNIWKSYKAGNYVEYDSSVVKYFLDRKIRWGAYGDPALIPQTIVSFLSHMSGGHTGYTHLWRRPEYQWAQKFFQASCDNVQDYLEASSAGWGTFNVRSLGATAPAGQTQCPAVGTATLVHCESCLACSGSYVRPPRHISIEVHGRGAKHVPI